MATTEQPLLRKCADGAFRPATEHDQEAFEGIPVGGYIRGNPKQPRHPEHHKKCFALLHDIYDNLPDHMEMTWTQFYQYMKVAAGCVDQCINHKGEVFYVVKSLSFADLDQLEFRKVYNAFVDVAVTRLGMGWVEEVA